MGSRPAHNPEELNYIRCINTLILRQSLQLGKNHSAGGTYDSAKHCIFYSWGIFSLSFMSSALFRTVWNSAKMLAWKSIVCKSLLQSGAYKSIQPCNSPLPLAGLLSVFQPLLPPDQYHCFPSVWDKSLVSFTSAKSLLTSWRLSINLRIKPDNVGAGQMSARVWWSSTSCHQSKNLNWIILKCIEFIILHNYWHKKCIR